LKKTEKQNLLMKNPAENRDIFNEISVLIEQARRKVAATINEEMVILY